MANGGKTPQGGNPHPSGVWFIYNRLTTTCVVSVSTVNLDYMNCAKEGSMKHGGARPGSGRPSKPSSIRKRSFTVSLAPHLIEWFRAYSDSLGRSNSELMTFILEGVRDETTAFELERLAKELQSRHSHAQTKHQE